MDQRVAFIADWLRDEWTMTELAERYQISRKTAYKWVDRYEGDPQHGLAARSRAPHAHGRAMAAEQAQAIVAVRRAHPHWGPKKLRAILTARASMTAWPVGEYHGRSVAASWAEPAASARALCRAGDAAAGGGAGAE
jgi:hypothetical protein